jgi:hypothetical protein
MVSDVVNLTIARSYVKKVLENAKIVKYLPRPLVRLRNRMQQRILRRRRLLRIGHVPAVHNVRRRRGVRAGSNRRGLHNSQCSLVGVRRSRRVQ